MERDGLFFTIRLPLLVVGQELVKETTGICILLAVKVKDSYILGCDPGPSTW